MTAYTLMSPSENFDLIAATEWFLGWPKEDILQCLVLLSDEYPGSTEEDQRRALLALDAEASKTTARMAAVTSIVTKHQSSNKQSECAIVRAIPLS